MGRLRGLDEFPSRQRRRESRITLIIRSIVNSQASAIGYGIFGLFLISSIPFHILEEIPKADIGSNYLGAPIINGIFSTGYAFLPWTRIFGYLLVLTASASLFVQGRTSQFRTVAKSLFINNLIASAYLASALLVIILDPPSLFMRDDERMGMERRISVSPADVQALDRNFARRTQQVETPSNAVKQEVANAQEPFPENGTVTWGVQGQPIGGKLAYLQIWDVTESPQDKVLRIRDRNKLLLPSQVGQYYAEVYVKSGQKVEIPVFAMKVYSVTAMSGDKWINKNVKFADPATVVDFGQVIIPSEGMKDVIVMGAYDQTASIVTRDKF